MSIASAQAQLTIDDLAARLDGVTKQGNGIQARCPAHDDRKASLSINPGDDGRILMHCQANCPIESVCAALEITLADLMPRETSTKKSFGKIVAVYSYQDENRKVISEAVRMAPKDFRQRVPLGNGEYSWSMKGVRRIPYHLPEVIDAIKNGAAIFIAEGEKDVDNLFKLGVVATCNAAGAGKFTADHAQYIKGGDLRILPDNDPAGEEHAQKVARLCSGLAKSIKIVRLPNLPPKGDVSDWIAAGGTLEEMEVLAAATPEWVQETETPKPVSECITSECFDDMRGIIEGILFDPGVKARERNRRISDMIRKWCRKQKRLLVDNSNGQPAPYVLMDDGAVVSIVCDSLALRVWLSRVCVNATDAAYKYILADLESEAVKHGRAVTFARYTKWTSEAIYISAGPCNVIKASAKETTSVRNGTDNVWFASDYVYPEWHTTANVKSPVDISALNPLLIAPQELPDYSSDLQIKLVQIWIVAAICGIRPLPILVFIGHMDCGKTTSARAIIKVARGNDFDVQSIPGKDRDLQTILTAAPVIALDNADGEQEPWFPDTLAMACTGGRIEFRTLYSDGGVFSRPMTAAVIITTRTPHFAARADIQSRILPIFFGERRDNARTDDSKLMDSAASNRDALLSWAVQQAATLLSPSVKAAKPGRFQRFAELVNELDPFTGAEALTLAYQAARVAVADLHPLIAAIVRFGKRITGTTKEIVATLQAAGFELDYIGGGKAIMNILREHRQIIRLIEHPRTGDGIKVTVEPITSSVERVESVAATNLRAKNWWDEETG